MIEIVFRENEKTGKTGVMEISASSARRGKGIHKAEMKRV